MAGEYEDAVLRDLKAHLQTAKIPLQNLSTLAQKGDDQLVKQFLSENIQIDGSGPEAKQSQLYIACFWGIKEIVLQLLQAGTNPNKQNRGSLWTPLHAATFQEHGPVVMMLLDNDAQPELPDSEGRTPKDFASASDKIWPLFAAMQLERTPRAELINKHIIRKGSAQTAAQQPGYGIKMAEYSGPSSGAQSDRYMQAAMMGDVLADDPDQMSYGSRGGGGGGVGEQPQLSLWKS
ncbi:uncharacterized protein LOC143294036 isoform X2 [Babylonia areolata]|uniref:uncharacterized protein LOC143294036 isoform X2 n=1 Tax=Babylonia areolata TaxID=304850 RepID=UPI003FD65304